MEELKSVGETLLVGVVVTLLLAALLGVARADECLLTVEQFEAYRQNIEAQRDKARAAAATFEGAAQLVAAIAGNATATAAAATAVPATATPGPTEAAK